MVRVVSREWQTWIKRGRQAAGFPTSKSIGARKIIPTGKEFKREGKSGIPPSVSVPQPQPEYTLEKARRAIGKAG
jgi:hypothetical protein